MALRHTSWRTAPASSRGRAFTLIELLVSISIIGVLIGMMLPALSGARSAAQATVELSAARDLMYAYHLAAESRGGWVIEGYPLDPQEGEPSLAYDARRKPLSGPAAKRYPWRLLPYVDYNIDGLYKDAGLLENAKQSTAGSTYGISIQPTLGLNQTFMGGSSDSDYGGYAFNPRAQSLGDDWYVRRIANAPRPGELLVFASAFSQPGAQAAGYAESSVPLDGYYKVLPPSVISRQWQNYPTREHKEAQQVGFVALRFNGKAAVGFLDGHAGLLGWEDLQDMRHWAPKADQPDWVLTPQR